MFNLSDTEYVKPNDDPLALPVLTRLFGRFNNKLQYILLLVVLVAYGYLFLNVQEVSDDAFIFFRFAKNFIEGNGLVYNPGERVEGYTGFLWLILVSLFMKLGIDPVQSIRILGFAAGLGPIIFMFALSKEVFKDTPPPWRPPRLAPSPSDL